MFYLFCYLILESLCIVIIILALISLELIWKLFFWLKKIFWKFNFFFTQHFVYSIWRFDKPNVNHGLFLYKKIFVLFLQTLLSPPSLAIYFSSFFVDGFFGLNNLKTTTKKIFRLFDFSAFAICLVCLIMMMGCMEFQERKYRIQSKCEAK